MHTGWLALKNSSVLTRPRRRTTSCLRVSVSVPMLEQRLEMDRRRIPQNFRAPVVQQEESLCADAPRGGQRQKAACVIGISDGAAPVGDDVRRGALAGREQGARPA